MKITKIYLFILMTFFIGSCGDQEEIITPDPITTSKKTKDYKATYPQQWMQTAYNAVKTREFLALDASRLYAYTAITMYESMVNGIENGKSLSGQLEGRFSVPEPDKTKVYDWSVVLCDATPIVLNHLLDNPKLEIKNMIETTRSRQEANILSLYTPSSEIVQNSKDYAKVLAAAIIEYANADRTANSLSLPYSQPTTAANPQFYDGNGDVTFFFAPFWWNSRPFAISGPSVCLPAGPYEYSTNKNSKYYKDVDEVYQSVKDPLKAATGQYWANNPGVSGTPAGSWVGIGNQLVDQHNIDIITTLKMYTLLTISTRDAFIAVWYTKFRWNLQRPVSYIRNVIGDKTWSSHVPTPPYPDYVSGTSANGGSSSTVLTEVLGPKKFFDNQHADKKFPPRTYETFEQAGIEAYHSRIYAGVHMRKACEDGFELGKCVAQSIIKRIDFDK